MVGNMHHIVRFIVCSRALSSQPRIQCKHRFGIVIWLGWAHGGRGKFQDQLEVDGILGGWLPFQSKRFAVRDEGRVGGAVETTYMFLSVPGV